MRRTMLLGTLVLSLTNCPTMAAQPGADVTVTALKPGVVCRDAKGEPVPGHRPQTPFPAEATTYDRVRLKGQDCYFNPGEYSTAPQFAPRTSDCPSGQIVEQSGKIKGTRSGEDLHWCDE
jgi:hypothetical protein